MLSLYVTGLCIEVGEGIFVCTQQKAMEQKISKPSNKCNAEKLVSFLSKLYKCTLFTGKMPQK